MGTHNTQWAVTSTKTATHSCWESVIKLMNKLEGLVSQPLHLLTRNPLIQLMEIPGPEGTKKKRAENISSANTESHIEMK